MTPARDDLGQPQGLRLRTSIPQTGMMVARMP